MEGLIFLVIILAVYFLPTIIAKSRNKRNTVAIFVLNLLLGSSGIGWIIALVWSVMHEEPATGGDNNPDSGTDLDT